MCVSLVGELTSCHHFQSLAGKVPPNIFLYLARLGLFMIYTLLPPSLNENVIFSDADMSSPGTTTHCGTRIPMWVYFRNGSIIFFKTAVNSAYNRALRDKFIEDDSHQPPCCHINSFLQLNFCSFEPNTCKISLDTEPIA